MFMAITAELEPFWDSWFASGESLYKFDIPRVAGPRGAQVQNHLRRSPWEGGMTCVRESKRERERERERGALDLPDGDVDAAGASFTRRNERKNRLEVMRPLPWSSGVSASDLRWKLEVRVPLGFRG
jgi:hypothetical protein